jgi:hypothetical protein
MYGETPIPGRGRTGLCDLCRHQRIVGNTRGSTFSLCERSKFDARFPKYPRLPVLECVGFEREGDAEESQDDAAR